MIDGILWVLQSIGLAFVNFFRAVTQPSLWLDWSNMQSVGRVIYYGASVEFFFVVLTFFLVLTLCGLIWNGFLWRLVRGLEFFANGIGRFFAWAGFLMVLQQIIIIFLQRIFRVSSIEFGPFAPFGYPVIPGPVLLRFDLSWWSEELKLYNAMVVCLCVTYTFVQSGHVRVDLLYAGARFRTKKVIDMLGALFFMIPAAVLTWLYAWFFLWRSLVTPKVSASESIEQIMRKANVMKWNVETIGFSPNGFNAYFLFKVLMVSYCLLVFLHAWAFFWRSWLEWREGPASDGKHLDRDSIPDATIKPTH
ncbi:MAG: C4-dicarboxylate ABC transporter permease [Paracoccaceae bacterium]|nr:MAG: C4-dicarboxylate ABC transporter permease [Paracoccaceae bacterium]